MSDGGPTRERKIQDNLFHHTYPHKSVEMAPVWATYIFRAIGAISFVCNYHWTALCSNGLIITKETLPVPQKGKKIKPLLLLNAASCFLDPEETSWPNSNMRRPQIRLYWRGN